MTGTIERRVKPRQVNIEERADGSKTISGYAAVFYNPSDPGTEYEMWEGCCERIAPGAFNRAIAENQDVLCTVNHDDDALLGRTANKTLRLSVDAVGLKYECDLPQTSDAIDAAILVKRGDIPGSSFEFVTKGVNWSTEADGCEVRTLLDVDLRQVGPVTSPAYTATTTAARSEFASVEQERAELAEKRKKDADEVEFFRQRIAMEN